MTPLHRGTLDFVIDLHTHILPGLDDGVASLAEAVDLARESWTSGVDQIVATPHVRDDYPTTRRQIDAGLEQLREALAAANVPLQLHRGAELDVRLAAGLEPAELERLLLGESRRYLLLEVPYSGSPHVLEAFAHTLRRRDIIPILAHPERSATYADKPDYLLPLLEAGCLVQVTAGSVVGDAGRRIRRTTRELLQRGMVHVLASDAHGHRIPRSSLADGALELDAALADYLTQQTPAAILAGLPVADPPRPARIGDKPHPAATPR